MNNKTTSKTRIIGWIVLFIGILIYTGEVLSTILGADPSLPPMLAQFRLFGIAVACWGVWFTYYDQAKVFDPKLNFKLMILMSAVVIVALITSLKLAGFILQS